MSWPIDYYVATAPNYSYSGNRPYDSSDNTVFNSFMNACSTYESSAVAALNAQLHDWTATGTIVTGQVIPTTPAEATQGGPCGSGPRGSVALFGGTSTSILITFGSSDLKVESSWIEDIPYVLPGAYNLLVYPDEALDPYYNRNTAGHTAQQMVSNMAKGLARGAPTTLPAGSSCGSILTAVVQAGLPTPPSDVIVGPYSFTITAIQAVSSGTGCTVTYTMDGYAHNPGAGYYVEDTVGHDGQWHLETKVTKKGSTKVGSCPSAIYMKSSLPLEGAGGKAPAYTSRLQAAIVSSTTPGSRPGGYPPTGTILIGNLCNTATYSTVADIWDPAVISGDIVLTEGYTIEGDYHPAVEFSFSVPGALVSLDQGTPLLGYNPFEGAIVYDMDLKKWGKWRQVYTCLVEFSGINAFNYQNFNYTDLGMTAGLLHSDGLIYLFDQNPIDSWIRYGKIGYYRLGMVHFLEARIDFRNYATGAITVDFSMDGRNLDTNLQQVYNYSNQLTYRVYPNQRSRWSTLTISGNYDLQYMEVRGNISCRR